MRFVCTILAVVFLSAAAVAEPLTVTTFVGSDGGPGYRDGVGSAARFVGPYGLDVDANGNLLVADPDGRTIRHVTPSGVVTTFAGVAGETGEANSRTGAARFGSPYAIASDSSGNVYVTDQNLRKISPSGAVTSLVLGIPFAFGMAVDSSGNVFLADLLGDTIRKVTPAGSMTTFVSTADAPNSLTIDSSNNLYFTTQGGGIYKCTPLGVITPIATVTGNPSGLDVDATGHLYVSVSEKIVKVAPNGTVTDFAGSFQQGHADGVGAAATFLFPRGVVLSPDGTVLYVADFGNNSIRRITVPGAVVTTLAGKANERGTTDGTGVAARFFSPSDIVLAPDGNLYVADAYNSRIRRITPAGVTSTLAGSGWGYADGTGVSALFRQPGRIVVGYDGPDWVLYVTDVDNDNVRKVTQAGVVTTVATNIDGALGIAVAADGDLYVSEFHGHAIRKIDMPTGAVTLFAGATGEPGDTNASGTAARFQNPAGLAFDGSGDLYVAETGNRLIRRIVIATAAVTTYAGSGATTSIDGTGTAASFISPSGLHAIGNDLYVTDVAALRLVAPGAVVTTVAGRASRWVQREGTGDIARFQSLSGIGGDSHTNLYLTDFGGNNIRKARIPGIADVAASSSTATTLFTTIQLETDPDTATSWTWSVDRRPPGSTSELSSSTIRNPTFVADAEDLYTFLLRAEGAGGIRYSTVSVTATACSDPLASVVASTATAAVCQGGTNGTATASVTGGGISIAYQWGYRTTSGGAITPISGETSAVYSIDGADFGGTGPRWLVVTVTPTCGVATVSNELPLEVTATPDATITASSGVFASSTQNFASVADAGAGATYTWGITNGTITAGQGTRSIAYTAGGTGSVALTVTVSRNGCAPGGNANVPIQSRPAGATMLYIVTPCRIVDTRGGAAIANGETRNFLLTGACGIPSDAAAVVANVVAVGPVANGWLALWPAGTPWGGTATMNYRTGRTRANNAVITLPNDGNASVLNSGGPQHIVIDVTGYFR